MRRLLLAALLPALAAPATADVQIKVHEGRLAVEAANVPLSEILDRLAKQTGMKVIYDGPPPPQVVKVSLTERSPAEAVLGVLEGRGINFAVIMNAAGTQIQTLLVSNVPTRIRPRSVVEEGAPPEGVIPGAMDIGSEPTPPPPPTMPAMNEAAPPPPMAPPGGTPTPVPVTLATPPPPAVSPFTPQGPGPIILPIPGATQVPR